MKEIRNYNGSIEIRANEDGTESRTIEGYGAVFNKWSADLGWFREKMDARSFDNVDMSSVIATFNHNFDNVLARSDSDSLTLTVDEVGLKYRFEAPNTTAGNDMLENIRNGNVKGSSFMFSVTTDEWEYNDKNDELDERTIMQVGRLIELGPVTNPAYPDTTALKRDYESAKTERDEARKLEDGKKNMVPNTLEDELRHDLIRAKYNN